MRRYRIVEFPTFNMSFEPQVWRWWFPIWRPLIWGTCTGHDYSPISYKTYAEALAAIDCIRNPGGYIEPIVHQVPPLPTEGKK